MQRKDVDCNCNPTNKAERREAVVNVNEVPRLLIEQYSLMSEKQSGYKVKRVSDRHFRRARKIAKRDY